MVRSEAVQGGRSITRSFVHGDNVSFTWQRADRLTSLGPCSITYKIRIMTGYIFRVTVKHLKQCLAQQVTSGVRDSDSLCGLRQGSDRVRRGDSKSYPGGKVAKAGGL